MTTPTHIYTLAKRFHLPPPPPGDNDNQAQSACSISAEELIKKLSAELSEQTERRLAKVFEEFKAKYCSQVVFKHNESELSIFFADYMLYSFGKGYSVDNYFEYEFYRKELSERCEFISAGYMWNELLMLNDYGEISKCDNKEQFSLYYKKFMLREYIDTSKASLSEFSRFVSRHSRFILKPVNGSRGKGIRIESLAPDEAEKAFQAYRSKNSILEELVQQHEEISAFHSHSLNTIRVVTYVDGEHKPRILFCVGRFGQAGRSVDNYSAGGLCAGIAPDTGRIYTDGITKNQERYVSHPDTGKVFKGFQYPCWEKVRATVLEAAAVNPRLRWIGWDLAITASGEVELIEGNTFPGMQMVQGPDQVGRVHIVEPLVKEALRADQNELAVHGTRIHDGVKFLSYSGTSKFWLEAFEAMESRLIAPGSCLLLFNTLSKLNLPITDDRDFPRGDLQSIYDRYSGTGAKAVASLPKTEIVMIGMLLEYIKKLPEFIADVCAAAGRQVLLLCRPWDKDAGRTDRWRKRKFAADFTEKFLLEEFAGHNFSAASVNKIVILGQEMWLYDFQMDR